MYFFKDRKNRMKYSDDSCDEHSSLSSSTSASSNSYGATGNKIKYKYLGDIK